MAKHAHIPPKLAILMALGVLLTGCFGGGDDCGGSKGGSINVAMLRIEVRDDGTGGADPDGHGLVGIADRATALGGRLQIDSPAGGGTLVAATLPLSRLTPDVPADTSLDDSAPG